MLSKYILIKYNSAIDKAVTKPVSIYLQYL
jgi:hypothetical protein